MSRRAPRQKTLDAAADVGLSPQAHAIAIRRDLAALETAFRQTGLATFYADTRRERGDSLVQAIESGTARLIECLETRSSLGTGGNA